jgi:uncharacterized protein YqeY
MSIHKQIKDDIKDSMIKKDTLRLTVLRGVLAAFMNEMVAKKITAEELSDEDAIAIIRRLVKQRKDSIEQFTKGNRMDLVANEKAEMEMLEKYLPQQMSREEIKKFVDAKVAEAGAIDKTKIGQFMGSIMKDLKGKADGMMVKEIIDETLK